MTIKKMSPEKRARGRFLVEKLGEKHTAGQSAGSVRTFESGATRDTDEGKLDFDGFLSPRVLEEFAKYMHQHRIQPDGRLRDSDNWKKGIPIPQYMKSMWRHFFAVWKGNSNGGASVEDLCALLFNVMGMLHEVLRGGELESGKSGKLDQKK